MNYAYEFCLIIEPLEKVFGPLGDDQKKIYYRQLGHYSESQLKGACEKLLETHRYMRFPLISEFIQNIEPENLDVPGPDDWHLTEFCQCCRNTGFYLEGEVARPCSCIHGRRKEAAFRLAKQGKAVKSDKPTLPDELQRQILKQTIRAVEEKRQERMAEQEPEDWGDDEIPF